jgi:hypothetical protein
MPTKRSITLNQGEKNNMGLSQLHSPVRNFLKPFKAINKKIHEITGKEFPGGAVPNPPEAAKPSPNYRQVGSMPGDKSGYPTQHLGDHK